MKVLVLSLHSRVRAHLWLEQVDIEHRKPGVVLREGVVKLGSDSLHLGEPRAWDVGEVMMLHVVAHIEGNVVPGSVVRVGLIASIEHVVLGYEVGGHGVDPQTQQGANEKVIERLEAKEIPDQGIDCDLDNRVEDLKP